MPTLLPDRELEICAGKSLLEVWWCGGAGVIVFIHSVNVTYWVIFYHIISYRPTGLTTEQFVDRVAANIGPFGAVDLDAIPVVEQIHSDTRTVSPATQAKFNNLDIDKVQQMFKEFDVDGSGVINCDEFTALLVKLGVAPRKAKDKKKQK